jgi:hypothetical protein
MTTQIGTWSVDVCDTGLAAPTVTVFRERRGKKTTGKLLWRASDRKKQFVVRGPNSMIFVYNE